MKKLGLMLLMLAGLVLAACGGGHPDYINRHMARCAAPDATALMNWAQGAGGNVGHSRAARVSNHNGYIRCETEEVGSSVRGSPTPPSTGGFYYQPYSGWYYDKFTDPWGYRW